MSRDNPIVFQYKKDAKTMKLFIKKNKKNLRLGLLTWLGIINSTNLITQIKKL